jgi:lipopolysaccharide transport system permease protein
MTLVIEPGRSAKNYWRDLWQYRELMYFLAWRDIAVRYKQTIIGVAWALIRPALTMLVFVGFRRMIGFPQSIAPEPILVFSAVLPWQFFSTALSEAWQRGRQRQSHFKGLFSAVDHPAVGGNHQPF